jgi:hypothetical protein
MAAGAAYGMAGGAAYEYTQAREDQRTKTMADAIGGAKAGETADDAGKRHLDDFLGDWNVDIWSVDATGKKITGNGSAKVVLENKERARFEFTDVKATGFDQVFTGTSLLGYSASNGFTLKNSTSVTPTRDYVGEYIPAKNAYNFYPTGNQEGDTPTGIIRSNVRIEVRVTGSNLFVVETYVMKDGNEVQVQSYRFTKK